MDSLDTKNAPYLTKEAKETQRRLLDAAEELFAQQGFDGTAIRDITTKAKRNPAAVNYFFGNKQELYEELFRQRLREMRDNRLASITKAMTKPKKPTLENLLHAYAVAFLEPFSDPNRNQRFMQLFSRELVDQRLPKSMFLEEMAAPVMAALEEALAVICPGLNKHNAQMSVHSIVGQLVHVMQVKVMFEGGHRHEITSLDVEEAIKHIVKFSAGGIMALVEGGNK
jgi:AcrR family transcriptional regulator